MENVIIIVVVLLIVSLAGLYIYKAKKNGHKCVGCPCGGSCSGQCGSCNSCDQCHK